MDMQEKTELLALARDLLKIPSTTGNEKEIAAYIREYFLRLGFEAEITDYNSVYGIFKGELPGPTVIMDGHIDTVLADAGQWKHGPFSAEIENGRLYGRGAADMKGALAAMMTAAKRLSEKEGLRGTVIVCGSSWEEYFEGYTFGKTIERLESRGLKPDYVLIGEASDLNIKRGQRGRTRILCRVKGKPSHSAHPEAGINAVYKAVPLIEKIRGLKKTSDPFLGDRIIELVGVKSDPWPVDSVVPFHCEVSYDLRLLPGDTEESIVSLFQGVLSEMKKEDPDFKADVCIAPGEVVTVDGRREVLDAFPKAWVLSETHELVKVAKKALEKLGQKPAITKYDFCTNGSYSAGEAGIPTLGYGPGNESLAHIIDEYIDIKDLEAACEGYYSITEHLLLTFGEV